jgi:hypothetical protein
MTHVTKRTSSALTRDLFLPTVGADLGAANEVSVVWTVGESVAVSGVCFVGAALLLADLLLAALLLLVGVFVLLAAGLSTSIASD